MENSQLIEMLTRYNPFWSSGQIVAGIGRDLLPRCLSQVDKKGVLILKGVRRCGKSTLLAQVMNGLLQRGIRPQQLLRLDLGEPLFAVEGSVELMEQVYRSWRERVCPEGKGYLFLDEIQHISGWQEWVQHCSQTEDVKIFVTGSSNRLDSGKSGGKGAGKPVAYEVFPLSFREFLRFKGVMVQTALEYMAEKNLIRHHFHDYLQYGGFPELVLLADDRDRERLLKHIFEDILYREMVTRHQIRDVANLRNLAVWLLTHNSQPTSLNQLKSRFAISQDKTENYLAAMVNSYLAFQVRKCPGSNQRVQRAGFKPYAIDTGLRNRVAFSWSSPSGTLVENVIHNQLRGSGQEICFGVDGEGTDFMVREGTTISRRIQLWYDELLQTRIPESKLKAFAELPQDSAECLLLTNDLEGDITVGSCRVRCLPVVKYLLLGSEY